MQASAKCLLRAKGRNSKIMLQKTRHIYDIIWAYKHMYLITLKVKNRNLRRNLTIHIDRYGFIDFYKVILILEIKVFFLQIKELNSNKVAVYQL